MHLNAPGPSPEVQVNQAGNERTSWKGHGTLDSGAGGWLLFFFWFFLLFFFLGVGGGFELGTFELAARLL